MRIESAVSDERPQTVSTSSDFRSAASLDTPDDEGSEYPHQVRAFQIHAAVFAAGMVGIFLVNLLTNLAAGIADQWSAWWSVWALIGWGLGIAVHGLVVRLARPGSEAPGRGAPGRGSAN